MSAQPTLITVTSMLFVKIPWALIRVYVKLDIQEMENNVVVRTVSRKYRKESTGQFKFPPFFFFSSMGSKLPSSHFAEVLVLIGSEDSYACEQVLHSINIFCQCRYKA